MNFKGTKKVEMEISSEDSVILKEGHQRSVTPKKRTSGRSIKHADRLDLPFHHLIYWNTKPYVNNTKTMKLQVKH